MARSSVHYDQLDLLSCIPESVESQEMQEPEQPIEMHNPHKILWHEVKAGFYLRMISKLMQGDRCNQQVRRQEIARLHELRQQELAIVDRIQEENR